MSIQAQLWQGLIVLIQYSLLALLYYFIYLVVKTMRQDGLGQQRSPITPLSLLTVIESGADSGLVAGQQFPLTETLTLGRGGHSDIVINDTFVSTEHACITRCQEGFSLTDLNSTNGTRLNGKHLHGETCLTAGDLIQVGSTTLQFER